LLRATLRLMRRRAVGLERSLALAGLGLAAIGCILALAASPAAAARLDLTAPFALAWRHALFAAAGSGVLLGLALLQPRGVRRVALGLFLGGVLLLGLVLLIGPEVKGAQRWLRVFGFSLQPSEFVKPGLVVLFAWMLAERERHAGFPGYQAAGAMTALVLSLLLLQPDVGQSALLAATLLGLLFLAGAPLWWAAAIAGAGAAVGGALYLAYPHVQARIAGLFDPGYQVRQALAAFRSGGPFGRGPGEGEAKMLLPDAHADFIYAVAAEEFGLLASLGLPGLYGWIAARGLARAQAQADPFQRLAASGLLLLFSLQAAIHIAVNLIMAPAKGMTLPFVSFGGSAMLGSAITLGLALALLRRPIAGARED